MFLLEAYEQLEKDLAKEVDAAVEGKEGDLEEARSKLSVTEEELHAQYEQVNQLREQLETAQVHWRCDAVPAGFAAGGLTEGVAFVPRPARRKQRQMSRSFCLGTLGLRRRCTMPKS